MVVARMMWKLAVRRVLAQAGQPWIGGAPRASRIDPYQPLIQPRLSDPRAGLSQAGTSICLF